MLSQGQFFDHQLYDSPAARQPRPRQTPDWQEAAKNYINTGSSGASGLTDRKARMAVNQVRVATGSETLTRNSYPETPVSQIGMRRHPGYWSEDWLPDTHSEHEWRKFGHVEEVPRNAVLAGQETVTRERVRELQKQPGRGSDPRWGGALHELPHAVKLNYEDHAPEYVLHQGHHRAISELTGNRPQLFLQARVVDRPNTVGEAVTASNDLADYRVQRAARWSHATDRVMERQVGGR